MKFGFWVYYAFNVIHSNYFQKYAVISELFETTFSHSFEFIGKRTSTKTIYGACTYASILDYPQYTIKVLILA